MVSASESTRRRFFGRLQLEAAAAPFVCARGLAAERRAAPRGQCGAGIVGIRAALGMLARDQRLPEA